MEDLKVALAAAFVDKAVEECKGLFRSGYSEFRNFFDVGVRKYLVEQEKKYSTLKTLLRGNTPVYIYDIYYSVKLVTDKRKNINTYNIESVFAATKYITITGDAGSGKSTLAKHLFLNSIKTNYKIPILVELRYLNSYEGSFLEYLISKINDDGVADTRPILERLLSAGKFVFFLDGFDELKAEVKSDVVDEINRFVDKYSNNNFILTTRPYSDVELLPRFHNYKIKSLGIDNGEIDEFIDLQLKDEQELAEKIKASIRDSDRELIGSFLANPLLLTLYILTFQSDASIPEKRHIFYRRVINALFSEHDSKTKLGYVREKLSGLSQEKFEKILKVFSFLSFFDARFNFDHDYVCSTLDIVKKKTDIDFDNHCFMYDMKSAVALWTEDNGVYEFAHRSLQEYFAAIFIESLGDSEKTRIYERITEKFGVSRHDSRDTGYFLSLCEEIDPVNFNKYYYIPNAEKLFDILNKCEKGKKFCSYLKFFVKSFVIDKKKIRFQIDDGVYKTIYIHFSETIKLNNYLRQRLEGVRFDLPNGLYPVDHEKFIDILEGFCAEQGEQLAVEYNNHLRREIDSRRQFVRTYVDNSRDLVDMI
jgi:GTPase SAR1 family protein